MSQTNAFRRKGIIKANQLQEATEWKTARGEILTGHAGDWFVHDDTGGWRTVTDDAFRQTHEHLSGNQWRRKGVVFAYQVSTPMEIRTLEGTSTALPGDWVVTDQENRQWPVPNEHFQQTYESVD